MRISTRLVLALGLTTTVVMVLYGVLSLDQREELLRGALERETETLARSAQIVANNALRDARLEDLDRVLGRIAEDPQTLVAAVLDEDGRVLAGGPAGSLACLRAAPAFLGDPAAADADVARMAGPDEEGVRGWIECDGGARWVALPVRPPGVRVVLGRRATLLERDLASSRRRILLTTIVLAAAAAAAILLVLRTTLSAPLARVMEGVRSLGGPQPPTPITVPHAAGELRDLAEAFNEMADRLEGKRRALVEKTEERVTLERQLRSAEKFSALGRMAGALGHELGSPLNVIAVRAEAIGAYPNVPADARRQAAEIVAEVDRIAQLVRSLRQVARGHSLEPGPVDLARVVSEVGAEAREWEISAGVSLRVEAGEPVLVNGDETLLRHAVANLVRNAAQAATEGPREARVWCRVERDRVQGRVVVEDDGGGIPAAVRTQLFEPFVTTRDVGEGMGLGLAIGQSIAEEHGGELRLGDRDGGGTRAELLLPLRLNHGEPDDGEG